MNLVLSTYQKEDCIFLLKDLTDIIEDVSKEEKERKIADGINYSEMITREEFVEKEINEVFLTMLEDEADKLADYIGIISDEAYKQKGNELVLVSLARAGSPVGVLMKHYLKFKYQKDFPHYSISIIRGKGIDENALSYILKNHPNADILFVDGWTGKGSITFELKKSIKAYNEKYGTNIDDQLAVIADPAKKSGIYGTREDICIPIACLNSTVSGLVSRTIHNEGYIGEKDFHGAKFYKHLKREDYSNLFIKKITDCFKKDHSIVVCEKPDEDYVENVIQTMKGNGLLPDDADSTRLKMSIGETSRAMIRRIPKCVYVKNKENPDLRFILYMANKKGVPIYESNTCGYQCVSVIK